MIYSYHQKSGENTFIMLHGTGGHEDDLLSLVHLIDPDASALGILGDVLENGLARYFKRYPDGRFDEADLKVQTEKLYHQIQHLLNKYNIDPKHVTVLGYSNGANIFINLLKTYQTDFKNAILLHPSSVAKGTAFKKQPNLAIFSSFGKQDPFISEKDYLSLIAEIREAQIPITSFESDYGHRLTQETLSEAKQFYIERGKHESI